MAENSPGQRYSIVCIIHGDGNYQYHDSSGKEYSADSEILKKMKALAKQNANAEVFLFHQKSKNKIAAIFSKENGTFYYFRNGHLERQESHAYNKGSQRFSEEVNFLRRFRSDAQIHPIQMFFYFGHEIPEWGGKGYDASYPDRTFTVDELAIALKQMSREGSKFDLVVLSSCFSGTPRILSSLAPHARIIIASPENLHLSYFDVAFLEKLDSGLQGSDILAFARSFAREAFLKLTREVQTAVTVAVYDADEVSGYLDFAKGIGDSEATRTYGESSLSVPHCDCAIDPAYFWPQMKKGVDLFYRPSRFGPMQNQKEHSGWECRDRRKLKDPK